MDCPNVFTKLVEYEQYLRTWGQELSRQQQALDDYPRFAARTAQLEKDRDALAAERTQFDGLKEQTIADKRAAAAARKDAERVLAEATTEAAQLRAAAQADRDAAAKNRAEMQAEKARISAGLAELRGVGATAG